MSELRTDKRQILEEWAKKTHSWICDLFQECQPHFDSELLSEKDRGFVLQQLNTSCQSTAESALLLVAKARLWDSEILVRSVTEGTLKFVFLTLGTSDERKLKHEEYDKHFAAIGLLKKHSRIEDFLKTLREPTAEEWRPFREILMSEEELAALRAAYPKKLRQEIEQKWSFAEISSALVRSKVQCFEKLGLLMFNYGMSSHLAHQDIDGIGIVWDRNNRDERRKTATELAHAGRLVSDVATMTWARALGLFRLRGLDETILRQFLNRIQPVWKETAEAEQYFHYVEYGTPLGTRLKQKI